jgi:V/A-type H+-transporting ATPase subunit C
MDNDYGYANARLRAMQTRLLTRADYAALLDEHTIEDVVARLTHAAYQPAIEAALIKASGWECLSEALRRHFAQTVARIAKFFDGTPQRLWKILIGRWQVFNLKTILRGQAHHVPADEILDALIPVGDLKESDLRRLVQQTSVRATVDLLATWHHPYARPLLEAMPRYSEHGDLAELELALDRTRYAAAFVELGKLGNPDSDWVRQILANEIDATNILTVIRLGEWGGSGARLTQRYGSASPAALLIKEGGMATRKLFAYKDIPALDQLVRELQDTDFGDALKCGEARYNEKHTLSAFEDEMDAKLTRQNLAFFHRDPLSIGIAIAYLAALANEIRNLRVIGRGKAAGWRREEIEKELRLWPS